jgi:hypothetical protein
VSSADRLSAKIPNRELYRMAFDAEGDSVTVLVEPYVTPTQVQFEPTLGYSGPAATRRFVENSPDAVKTNERRIEETAAFLEQELGQRPHWLRSGRVFVVTVTPQQLATIASSPLIRSIRPNAEWKPAQ